MTLLEVLIVMVILALIGTIGGLQLTTYLGRARTDTARLQMQEITTALELFRVDVGRAPTTAEGLAALLKSPDGLPNWRGPYLRKPENLQDPWQRAFLYKSPGEHSEFDLASMGADNQPGGDGENSDVKNWR
jgi:general secretion pathway protein G